MIKLRRPTAIMCLALMFCLVLSSVAVAAPGYIIGGNRYLSTDVATTPAMMLELNGLIGDNLANLIVDLDGSPFNYKSFITAGGVNYQGGYQAYAQANPSQIPAGTMIKHPDGSLTPDPAAQNSGVAITAITASNGQAVVTLGSAPAVPPVIADFTVTQKIGDTAATTVVPTAIAIDATGKIITLTLPTVPGAAAAQSVVISAAYKTTAAMAAAAFTVAAGTGVQISSVTAVTTTKLTAVLSSEVDGVVSANFVIPGITVSTATLEADKKTVSLTTSVIQPVTEYTLRITGLTKNAVLCPDATLKFTTPSIATLYSGTTMKFTPATTTTLKADGASSMLVAFELRDGANTLLTTAEDVVVSFTSTFGNFAEKRVTVQNGIATVMYTSEALTAARTADLVGTIVEAKDSNLIGIKATKSVILDPNPNSGGQVTTGASVTEAEAAQADRVILYFNKDVTVAQYVNPTTKLIDATKATIVVTENVNNDLTGGTAVAVKGLMPVTGNTKALQAILDVADPAFPLNDNCKIKVAFTDSTGSVAVPSTVSFNLTDARKPEIVRVDREGTKIIKVTFSEPVTNIKPLLSAQNLANWSIDGKLLSDASFGTAAGLGALATATIGVFNPLTGDDNRSVVTITLGKTNTGNQIYFAAGTHSVQGANIGDYAAETDPLNNKMNTQTLDFVIPPDTDRPVAEVIVQSPEQWLVKYNKAVDETAAQFAAKLKLEKFNTTTSAWANDPQVVSYGVAAVSDANLDLVVTKYGDNLFLVETDYDWSRVHNTDGTNKSYYNYQYRLAIPANAVTNPANGLKSLVQTLPLNDAMLTPDITSPVINQGSIIATPGVALGTSFRATMSEPVKLNTTANAEGATASQSQGSNGIAANWANIPVPTARFIKSDNSVTIPGNVAAAFVTPTLTGMEYERILTVTPATTLTPGDWTLSIESISDDIGNTAATATGTFTVVGPTLPSTTFNVAWAYADKDYDTGLGAGTQYVSDNVNAAGTRDAVYVKFTKPAKITGGAASALTTTNYTLNGKALPDGTQIIANINGYDNYDAIVDSVTIILPDLSITDVNTTVLNITAFIEESASTATLGNPGEKKLAFNYGLATVTTPAQLKAALADATIRNITLGGAIALTENLTISKLVDINLGANNLTAGVFTLTVNTTETGRMVISGAGTIDVLTVNAPNAELNVAAGTTVTTLTITDLYGSSLTNAGTITTLNVNDNTSVNNVVGGTIATLTVSAGKTVTINNAGTITTITNNGTVTGATPTGVAGTFAVTTQGADAVVGTAQVETATVTGDVGGAGVGNYDVIVTGVGIAGSPLTVPVAVANSDNAAAIAGKVRTALGIPAITGLYNVGGAGADITLTAKTNVANEATLNIELFAASSTATGTMTNVATSANTTAGVAAVAGATEVATFTVTSGATATGNVYVTVNNVATPVAVTAGNTAADVATAIAAALTVAGYTDAAAGSNVTLTFTAGVGLQTDLTGAIQ